MGLLKIWVPDNIYNQLSYLYGDNLLPVNVELDISVEGSKILNSDTPLDTKSLIRYEETINLKMKMVTHK